MDWGLTEDHTKKFIQRAIAGQREQPRQNYELAIDLKDNGQIIGGFEGRDEQNLGPVLTASLRFTR